MENMQLNQLKGVSKIHLLQWIESSVFTKHTITFHAVWVLRFIRVKWRTFSSIQNREWNIEIWKGKHERVQVHLFDWIPQSLFLVDCFAFVVFQLIPNISNVTFTFNEIHPCYRFSISFSDITFYERAKTPFSGAMFELVWEHKISVCLRERERERRRVKRIKCIKNILQSEWKFNFAFSIGNESQFTFWLEIIKREAIGYFLLLLRLLRTVCEILCSRYCG